MYYTGYNQYIYYYTDSAGQSHTATVYPAVYVPNYNTYSKSYYKSYVAGSMDIPTVYAM